jgi:hypothetical protein
LDADEENFQVSQVLELRSEHDGSVGRLLVAEGESFPADTQAVLTIHHCDHG